MEFCQVLLRSIEFRNILNCWIDRQTGHLWRSDDEPSSMICSCAAITSNKSTTFMNGGELSSEFECSNSSMNSHQVTSTKCNVIDVYAPHFAALQSAVDIYSLMSSISVSIETTI